MKRQTILHIVPRLPGQQEAVGNYASCLADELSRTYGAVSQFVDARNLTSVRDFAGDSILLHYVNYGYQKRGLPFHLPAELRDRNCQRVVTIFHELYASGPPWRSAFWLKPFQRRIAQSIARLSDACVTTSETARAQLNRLAPGIAVSVQPVPSGFGEPALDRVSIEAKDPHRWVICGGTSLLAKSVRSFIRIASRVPEPYFPRELSVLGGTENPAIRRMLNELQDVKWNYQPGVAAGTASEAMSCAAFGWLDYFHHPTAPVDALFKSSVFAALCAHGVTPVFPHPTAPLVLEGETFPGLFFVESDQAKLPSPGERAEIGWKFYDWYRRRASLERLTSLIAHILELEGKSQASA